LSHRVRVEFATGPDRTMDILGRPYDKLHEILDRGWIWQCGPGFRLHSSWATSLCGD